MLIYLAIIFSLYAAFLVVCMRGWQKVITQKKAPPAITHAFVSVLVPFRNEGAALPALLTSLRLQDFPHDRYELILVDDHSQDEGPGYVKGWIGENPKIKCTCITAQGIGKKNAIAEGIEKASGQIILTTDADCLLPVNWISSMVRSFKENTSMVAGLVKVEGTTFFSELQSLEFNSLMASGAAFMMLGYPVMCNGASLAYRKDRFEAVDGFASNRQIPSGDDEFLMRKFLKQFPGSVIPVNDTSAVVITAPQPSVKAFIQQRMRWAGKWRANESAWAKGMAVFIWLWQASWLFSLFLAAQNPSFGLISLIAVKILLELVFLYRVQAKLHHRFSFLAFLVLQLLYPIYVILIGLLSQGVSYQWKGRRYR
jgi:poly-beta-1,6-N-acetyl-D-glucosamine synthase